MDLVDPESECPGNVVKEKRDTTTPLNMPRTPVPSARTLEP